MTSQPEPVRWLSASQLASWLAFEQILVLLPAALDRQLQRDAELSMIEYMALAMLSDQPTRSIRMSELAELTSASLSRLSHMVNRLERRGFIRREPDPDNGRYTIALLTEAGQAKLVEAAPGHVRAVRDMMIDEFDDAELAALAAMSARIRRRLDEYG